MRNDDNIVRCAPYGVRTHGGALWARSGDRGEIEGGCEVARGGGGMEGSCRYRDITEET